MPARQFAAVFFTPGVAQQLLAATAGEVPEARSARTWLRTLVHRGRGAQVHRGRHRGRTPQYGPRRRRGVADFGAGGAGLMPRRFYVTGSLFTDAELVVARRLRAEVEWAWGAS
jgi:hypothetical protein